MDVEKGRGRSSRGGGGGILYAIGSILGFFTFSGTVWGSGILNFRTIENCINWKGYRKLDIRALRGPLSKQLMSQCGYLKKNQGIAMGDPAILMPLVYESKKKKVFETSIVLHLAENRNKDLIDRENINYINIETRDYESFIDQVVASKKIISSSLHGIILTEAYGVPAVFLMSTKNIENQMIKYYDWYWSTGRYTVKIARSIDEALAMEPMELPDLKKMQQDLLDSFPYDIFEK